ncbi:MAG: MATE family efflux transporter [Dysgonamonadaceae bacterium]|nr:MATE family efflux transporter [Dysgonamonadaceae bacterium]
MANSGIKNLTEGRIFRQLAGQAVPVMATGFIQMAYTLTDMGWLGHLGSREMAAVGAMGIILWFVDSLALLPKMGAEIGVAQSIGLRDVERAKQVASHTVSIGLLMGVATTIMLLVFARPVISLFNLETELNIMASEYLKICCLSLPAMFLIFTFSGIYNGTGNTSTPFYFMTIGLVCNMVLDPLFIFGFGLHTRGAAIATVISQLLVVALFIIKIKKKDGILERFPFFVRLRRNYTEAIIRLGLPVAAMNCLFSLINFYMARIASICGGHLGVMSQTTGSQIEGITWNSASGFSTALGTFSAQNHAAGKNERAVKAYKYTLILLLTLGFAVSCAFLFAGKPVFSLFVVEEKAQLAGADYLFYMGFSQMFMMLEIGTAGIWNGFGRTSPPAVVSIAFNLLRIPLALWLTQHYGIDGVWLAIVISSVFKGTVSAVWWQVVWRKKYKASA